MLGQDRLTSTLCELQMREFITVKSPSSICATDNISLDLIFLIPAEKPGLGSPSLFVHPPSCLLYRRVLATARNLLPRGFRVKVPITGIQFLGLM